MNAVSSGHNKNLWSFDTSRWEERDGGAGVTVIDYYSGDVLNDLRVYRRGFEDDAGAYSDLDLLKENGIDLSEIRVGSPFEDDLFEGSGPASESEWPQCGGSWDQYMWACNQISAQYRSDNLQELVEEAGYLERARLQRAQQRISDAEEIDEQGILLHRGGGCNLFRLGGRTNRN